MDLFERAAAHNREMRQRFMQEAAAGGQRLECDISVPLGQEDEHMQCYETQTSVEVEYESRRYIGRLVDVETDEDEGVCIFKFVGLENARPRQRRERRD